MPSPITGQVHFGIPLLTCRRGRCPHLLSPGQRSCRALRYLPAALYHGRGVEAAGFKICLYEAFIGRQLFKKLSYTLLASGGAPCTSPGCRASPSLGRMLLSSPLWFWPWRGVLPHLTTLGPFGGLSIITFWGLKPFTSSPNEGGRGEQQPRAQEGSSEGFARPCCQPTRRASPQPPAHRFPPDGLPRGLGRGRRGITQLKAVAVLYPGTEQTPPSGISDTVLFTCSSRAPPANAAIWNLVFKASHGGHKWICTGSRGRLNPLVSHRAVWCGN